MSVGNGGSFSLPSWRISCNDKNNDGKTKNFIRSSKTNNPTDVSGATSLPLIGNAFMYFHVYSNEFKQYGNFVFVSFERTDIFQITNKSFYCNRFSILTSDSHKSMGRFRIQLLLEDNTWSSQYTVPKNDQYSDTSTDWTLLNFDFNVKTDGIKLIFDEIDSPHADICFSDITVTHSVY